MGSKWWQGVRVVDPEVYRALIGELERQRSNLELIASENFAPVAVLEACSSVMTNKYAEGYPSRRFYGGCRWVDEVENLARERAKKLFEAEHANVQPHSGSQANTAVYLATLKPGETILSMSLSHGGHLSHGAKFNISGKYFKVVHYGVDRETETINYDEVYRLAEEAKPKLIVAGASAYPRVIDFGRFREIADAVGAYLMVDMAHIAGLVAAKVHPSPVPHADFVTATTHKTMRGPRGGFILTKAQYAKAIDRAVFPGIQGGPLMHIIAAKAVSFRLAMTKEFKEYQERVVRNAKALANALKDRGFRLVSGGTDNHLILVDLRPMGITGKEAEGLLESVGITVNKNAIPFDPQKPTVTSGIRIGTPAVTTRGMGEKEMEEIADIMAEAIKNRDSLRRLGILRERVRKLVEKFPLYPEIEV